MKISLVINSLAGGGAERRFQTLANHWSRCGVSVQIVTLEGGEPAYESDDAVDIVALGRPLGNGIVKTGAIPIHSRLLARHFKNTVPDISISTLARSNIAHALSSRRHNVKHPIVLSEANPTAVTYRGGGLSQRTMRALIRRYYDTADDIIAISSGVRESLCSLGVSASKVRVVSNPIDLARVSELASEETQAFERRRRHRLVAMGRLEPVKNYGFLIEALSHLRRLCDAELLIIGDGPQRDELQQLTRTLNVEDSVIWAGWQSNPFPHLKSGDVFVHAPTHEGFGNILIEAMQLGIPIVCRESPGGVHDIVDGPETGVIVEDRDAGGFAGQLHRLLADASRLRSLSQAGLRRAQCFEVAGIADQYLAVARAIIDDRGR